jgi:hypothetical protein
MFLLLGIQSVTYDRSQMGKKSRITQVTLGKITPAVSCESRKDTYKIKIQIGNISSGLVFWCSLFLVLKF